HGRRRRAVQAADGVDFAVPIGGGGGLVDRTGRGGQRGPGVGGDVIAQERAGDGEAAVEAADEVEVGGGLDEAVAQLWGIDPGGDGGGRSPGAGRRHREGAGGQGRRRPAGRVRRGVCWCIGQRIGRRIRGRVGGRVRR